ncbi:MAG TPA: hypothetical protein VFY20_00650 [Gemmatimonadales bacterium]|nr:hypothetical protein [Gemmatimonadales bacterium]
MRRGVGRALVAALLLTAPALTPAAAQHGPSTGTAQLVGVLSTAIPVVAGVALTIATDDPAPVLLGSAGMVLGPMVGNIVGGLGTRAAVGTLVRGGVWIGSMSLLFTYANDESGSAEPYLVGAIAGGAALTGLVVWDLVTIPGAMRKKRGTQVNIAPTWVPAARAPGLALRVEF